MKLHFNPATWYSHRLFLNVMTGDERLLINGCIHGDKSAWDNFVKQYSNLVHHSIQKTLTLYHVQRRDDVAEDLFQEFFVSILRDSCRKLAQFRGDNGCTLASWVGVISARLTIDFLRRQKTPEAPSRELPPADERPAEEILIEQAREASLVAAVNALTSREQLIVKLHFGHGLGAGETASVLKISTGAFYTQKSRLLDKLRTLLTKAPQL